MRVMTSVVFGCFLVMSVNSTVFAQEGTRSVKDPTELSETVNGVFSKNNCTHISEISRDRAEARHVSMTFRFRCEGKAAEVLAMLNELKEVEGLALQQVVKSPKVNPKNDHPSLDIRFDVIALTAVEG